MDLETVGKVVLVMALGLALLGVLLIVGGRIGLGSLPGDIRLKGDGWGCFFPITSMIILSLLLTLLINVIIRLFR